MKKLIYLNVVLLFALISGCNDDYMERFPLDANVDDTFWKTPEHLKTYANQFYSSIIGASRGSTTDPDNLSDNQTPVSPDSYTYSTTTIPASAGASDWQWGSIRNCNYFLTHYQTAEGDAVEINKYVGEVRYFRAKFYFDKVLAFGDVPWYDADLNVDSEAELFKARDSRILVVDKIMEDLDFAIANLPENPESDRIGKYAAAALQSRIALFEGTFRKYHVGTNTYSGSDDGISMFRKCVSASEMVMASGKFEIVKLSDNNESNYDNLFIQADLSGSKEGIFVRKYKAGELMHNLTREVNEAQTGFSKDYIESYLCDNGLPIEYNGISNPNYLGDELFDDEIDNRDPRLKQSIWHPDRIWNISPDGSQEKLNVFPDFNRNTTGYKVTKHRSPLAVEYNYFQSTLGFYVYRYGEILLNYAEAKAELGECTQTVLDNSINLIRDRIDLPHMTTDGTNVGSAAMPGVSLTSSVTWPDYGYTISPILNEVRRERRIELAVEGFRFNDIVRWRAGKLLNNPKTVLGLQVTDELVAKYPEFTGSSVNADGFKEVYPGKAMRVWDDKLYLKPLPIEELSINENLTQNPGWK